MRAVFAVLALLVSTLTATVAAAQEAWIQVEARPTRAEAEDRARAYARTLPDVTGYEMAAGWHAIVLGPKDSPLMAALARMGGGHYVRAQKP